MIDPEDHSQYMEALSRDERALEGIASALNRLADVAEKFYASMHPEKKLVRPATLTTVQTAEEKELAESIQGSESTLEQWKDIGPREKAFLEGQKKTTKS